MGGAGGSTLHAYIHFHFVVWEKRGFFGLRGGEIGNKRKTKIIPFFFFMFLGSFLDYACACWWAKWAPFVVEKWVCCVIFLCFSIATHGLAKKLMDGWVGKPTFGACRFYDLGGCMSYGLGILFIISS